MKCDIIIAGVGGQGIISIAAVLGRAALDGGLTIKQSEIHGMAQRGGAVHSHLRLSDRRIASDVVPHGAADIILSMEPMEALRYLPFLSAKGRVITNSVPFENIEAYPSLDEIHFQIRKLENHILFDAEALAKENGSPRSTNIAMLGAAAPFIEIPSERFEKAIEKQFASKGERVIQANLTVYRAAREVSEKDTAAAH